MLTEDDLKVLHNLTYSSALSAIDLAQRPGFAGTSIPDLVARLKTLAGQGYVEAMGPSWGVPEDKDIPYVLTYAGLAAGRDMP